MVSTGEDIAAGGLLALALAFPAAAIVIAIVLLIAAVLLLRLAGNVFGALFGKRDNPAPR